MSVKEIFNQVLEKEKHAASLVQEAKEAAAALLVQADADSKDLIKKEKEKITESYARQLEAFAESLKSTEEDEKKRLSAAAHNEMAAKERVVQLCAEKVADILLNGVDST